MVPYPNSQRIVRTIPGKSTGPDDDVMVCEDGTAWVRIFGSDVEATATAPKAKLINGRIVR